MTTMTQMIEVRAAATASTATHTVSIINGTPQTWALLEPVLDAYHFDVVFVESSEHAYSHVKHVRPNLIILWLGIGDPDGFQVLSMLRLDDETRTIPLLTYVSEYEGHATNETGFDASEVQWTLASTSHPWPMN